MEQAQARDPHEEAAEVLEQRRMSYVRLFNGAASKFDLELVLADLARFCRAHESTFDPNVQIAAKLDGRREVWLRIIEHAGLNQEELLVRYHSRRKVRHAG